MKTRNIIPISNHPTLLTITRAAQIRCMIDHSEENTVEIVINIFSYLDGIEIKDMFRQITLTASNENMVNSHNFQPVQPNEFGIYPDGSIGEYDILYDMIKNNIKNYFDLQEMYIMLRINQINNKLYS